ncbi:MAG TPA: apolipoprotein N-acyltransferase [Candidatus Polarisedimenticolaceae bacterium]|nr:apolipoprotein N-acyltransferase [Candidatus Polarisedimenticolaceae bacterium]
MLLGLGYCFPLPICNFTAFLPLLHALETPGAAGLRARLRVGFVFGLVTHLISLHFLYVLLGWTWLVALLYVSFAGALALRIAAGVAVLGWLRRRTALPMGLLLPASWIPLEWLQAFGDLRMTGEHLAHTLARYPFLVQFADLGGHYAVGAFLLAMNGLLYDAVVGWGRPPGRRALVCLGLLLTAVLAYDSWCWLRSDAPAATLRVGLVQPNVPLEVKSDAERTALDQWQALADLSSAAAAQGARVIVWPETARPQPLYHRLDRPETYVLPEVQALARRLHAAIVTGVEYVRVRDTQHYDLFNAAMAVDAEGGLDAAWGAKVYLVPFTEAMPFRGLLEPLIAGRGGGWAWLQGGFTPGPADALLDVAGARVGALVCYEQMFPDLPRALRRAGAQFQVVLTNDAWFGRSLFQRYNADVLRLRAIENRTEFVRAANTGISGFVDDKGRYHQRTALFERAVEVRDVRLTARRTLYDRWGDLVVGACWAALGAALWLALRNPARNA